MGKLKLILEFFKIIFTTKKNEGIISKSNYSDEYFEIYSISSASGGSFTFLISIKEGKDSMHRVEKVIIEEKEFLSSGIINEKLLVKTLKSKLLTSNK